MTYVGCVITSANYGILISKTTNYFVVGLKTCSIIYMVLTCKLYQVQDLGETYQEQPITQYYSIGNIEYIKDQTVYLNFLSYGL